MHQIIHAIVDAQSRDDALGVARGSVFDRLVGATVDSSATFDYYVTFNEEGTHIAGKGGGANSPLPLDSMLTRAANFSREDGTRRR